MSRANSIPKVKLVVVGDSGVGKSSFVYLASHHESLQNASWTIGCSIEVRLHEYKQGTPGEKQYFIEFWDVGGNYSHKNARHVFYHNVNGIILVHDLTNRKSEHNLRSWLSEVLVKESDNPRSHLPLVDGFDVEQFGGFSKVYGSKKIPVFCVGTRLDQLSQYGSTRLPYSASVAEQCGADEIFVNCLEKRSLAPGSSNAVKLSRFFDKVIERQLSLDGASVAYPNLDRDTTLASKRNKYSSVINMGFGGG